MKWRITFYNKKVESTALALPEGILANFLHIAALIEEFGPDIGMPYTRALGSGLFEIRARGKEGIARVMYCVRARRDLVLLNVFIKKSAKAPRKESACIVHQYPGRGRRSGVVARRAGPRPIAVAMGRRKLKCRRI